ncbi:hypothetical protein C8R44DRAFT_738106 [Mycena epipterygia]|nr:hypothetical protein C8R44DRAFT_738106 [Mycena epipterygia]
MPQLSTFRNLFSSGRRPRQSIGSTFPVPPEIWEFVLEELTDKGLRTTARWSLSSTAISTTFVLVVSQPGIPILSPPGILFGLVEWFDKARFILKPHGSYPNLRLPVCSEGNGQRSKSVGSLYSVNVRVIPASEAVGPLTLIGFDADSGNIQLHLGTSSTFSDAIPISQLTRIISVITLPSLRNLHIHEDVDPMTLTAFLSRNPDIHSLIYRVQTVPLLNPFGLSPNLAAIHVTLERDTARDVASLKRGLRRLSLHTPPITLPIFRWYGPVTLLPIDDEERQIVGCLYDISPVVADATCAGLSQDLNFPVPCEQRGGFCAGGSAGGRGPANG